MEPKELGLYPEWPPSHSVRYDIGLKARAFRGATSRLWSPRPVLPACDEARHVVHVDGL